MLILTDLNTTNDRPLLIGVSARALFDMDAETKIINATGGGLTEYRAYQKAHRNDTLKPGTAYGFVKRMLALNALDNNQPPLVEFAIISHMDPDTSVRVMKSLEPLELYPGVGIGAFTSGASLTPYLKEYGIRLYLSKEENSVREAVDAGLPAGCIMTDSPIIDDTDSNADNGEIRIAFDFDGILASDDSEKLFQSGGLEAFNQNELDNADVPMQPGPLVPFLRSLSVIQHAEDAYKHEHPDYHKRLRIAIITARNAVAGVRVMSTLDAWHITVDEALYMNGHNKNAALAAFKPHMFFDDSPKHINRAKDSFTSVHVPFGIANNK